MLRPLALFLLTCLPALGQPAFDAASVKPSDPVAGEGARVLQTTPTSLTMRLQSLQQIIQWAYDVRDSDGISGPSWMESEEFDISARAPPHATVDQLRLMLQTLLKQRFQLALHHESRTRPVYYLLPAKGGPKLAPTEGEATTRNRMRIGPGRMTFDHWPMTMPQFADVLHSRGAVDRPVVDKTGIAGVYAIDLSFACSITAQPGELFHGCASDSPGDSAIPSIFRAIEEQLGLRLESQKAPIDVLVIDHVDKVPTGN